MAPRKRVKGTKPKETMRQRQQRLLREQRAARNKNVRSQKALPPKATTGGRRYSSGTASSRRAQAAAKQVRAAQGTKGTTVRQGQPAGAAARRYGADRVARSVRRAQLETAVRGAARRFKGAGPVGAILTGAEIAEAYKKTNRAKAESGRGAGRRTFNEKTNKPKQTKKEQPKGKVKVQKDNTTVTRKKSRDYQAEKKAREAKASQPKKQQQTQTPKPKVKKGSGVERRLPKGKERKDRAYSAVQELRAMRERSKERQGKKKKQSRANQAGYPGNRNY
jgi:hypothetical protein